MIVRRHNDFGQTSYLIQANNSYKERGRKGLSQQQLSSNIDIQNDQQIVKLYSSKLIQRKSRQSCRVTKNQQKQNNIPFVSIYRKDTRLNQIMKLKVRPTFQNQKKEIIYQDKDLSCSSIHYSQNSKKGQEKTRLQKIMAIKVLKPNIPSTLANYEPKIIVRQSLDNKDNFSTQETLFECQQNYKMMLEAQQKKNKQWKMQQNRRQVQLRKKLRQKGKQYEDQRRKQTLFENMVNKQIKKFEKQRQLTQRKNGGFAIYVYS